MVAALLYVIGLVSALVTIVLVGMTVPGLIDAFNAALAAPGGNILMAVLDILRPLQWAVLPFVGGLAVMGFGRIIMLLSSIDRALRGNA